MVKAFLHSRAWAKSDEHRPATGASRFPSRVSSAGFTLVELIVVVSIIMILLAIAAPMYRNSVVRSKEAVLSDDLFTMRQVIEQYTMDRRKAPQTLQDLVPAYLPSVPRDPFTKSADTWKLEMEDATNAVDPNNPGILNVRSGSDAVSLDGTPYNTW